MRVPRTAVADPISAHASPADRAYAYKLINVYLKLVTAAKETGDGLKSLGHRKYTSARTKLRKALSTYGSAKRLLNKLHPTPRMKIVSQLMNRAVADYWAAVRQYIVAADKHDGSIILNVVPLYKRGTKELGEATKARDRVLKS
jgi:hypothetical protein